MEPESHSKYIGLSSLQVEESRKKFGANVITPPEKEPWWKLYLEKYEDPVIRILMIAAVIAISAGIFDGKYLEGIGIMIAIFLATTMAFLNEYKANKEFDILNQVNDDFPVKVIRNGAYDTIPKRDVVVGDIILCETGEEIPADGELLEVVSLQIDEGKLTGEAVPVNKFPKNHPEFKAVTDSPYPENLLYKGTMVADGHCIMSVTAVGDKSEIANIASAATEENENKTPLNQQLEKLSKQIGVVGLGVAALTYGALILKDYLNGILLLNGSQLYASIILHLFISIALIKVWLPIFYDFLEWIGSSANPPAFLDEEGLSPWLKNLGYGVLTLLILAGGGFMINILPGDIKSWIPASVLSQYLEYFMIAVTIIVVAVPEGLAMSVTLSLAYSMRKMTASNNLVRKMDACETIGAATCICSDKTGTLTKNEMNVYHAKFPDFMGNGNGNGLSLIAEAIGCNSTANLGNNESGTKKVIGNPTEGALLLWLNEKGYDYLSARENFEIKHQWTFSNETKMMGTLGLSPLTKREVLHIKGAPEIVLNKCSNIVTQTGVEKLNGKKNEIIREMSEYQKRGMRTIGVAFQEEPKTDILPKLNDLTDDFVWLGFFAIADPIREEVPGAIQACKEAGIDVKIVTGDNADTAAEIARQIGLHEYTRKSFVHLSGTQFSQKTDDELVPILPNLAVLSRAKPMDKLRLIRLLKANGHVVAVTGDGTNDAPALNQADVGLAMGKSGTALAKQVSDVILLDDSFRSIVSAVKWGRSLYENIQRFILFQLTINVAALGIALLGPFLGVQLPLTVTQMLWVNLIMDTFAALALATEPPHDNVLKREPRSPEDFIVTTPMAKQIFGIGALFLVILASFLIYIQNDGKVTDYELSLFFSLFVMLQFWNLFNAKCLNVSNSAFKDMFANKSFVAIATSIFFGQILIIQFGGHIFRTVPLSFIDWFYIIGSTSLVLWVGEIIRFFKRKNENMGLT
ncbi:MAG: calcium-translocating P-type ATPase, PMCA-type [Ignavibacteria bacterium]|nr:calcium-translocating P-type ATPase, PMCA-type [Ignavibacteria bacterium]